MWPQSVGHVHSDSAVAQNSPAGNPTSQQPAQQQRVWCQRIVFELKLIHEKDGFDSTLQQGLQQTSAYMDSCKATEGYLLLFDRRKGRSWDERIWVKQEQIDNGQSIMVWGL
ncbi:MAG: hypothetical protein AAF310_00785 [Myxococcota bacterium]